MKAAVLLLVLATSASLFAQQGWDARDLQTVPDWRFDPTNSRFESIVLKHRSGCLACADDELVLRADRTAEYIGHRNVPMMGRFVGRVTSRDVARLFGFVEESGFMNLSDGYGLQIRDDDLVQVTVALRTSGEKTVTNRAVSGPLTLWVLQQAIVGVASNIKWTPVPDVGNTR